MIIAVSHRPPATGLATLEAEPQAKGRMRGTHAAQ
jgi:hypothetical protein